MRILIINPSATTQMTCSVETTARKCALPDTLITCVNPDEGKGPKVVETEQDVVLAAEYVLDVIRARDGEFDGFLVACAADPGVAAARQLTRTPVAGFGESALMTACSVAKRFSILCPSTPGGAAAVWAGLCAFGLENRCASVKITEGTDVLGCLALPRPSMAEVLCALGRDAITHDGAEALMLLCSGMTGTREILEDLLNVPVVDGIVSALKTLEQVPRA